MGHYRYLLIATILTLTMATMPCGAETTIGSASARISHTVNVQEVSSLNFGNIQTNGQSDTVSINAVTNTISSLNGNSVFNDAPVLGIFAIAAQPNASLSVSFTDSILQNGTDTITLNNFNHSSGTSTLTTDITGLATLNIGASLEIANNQANGLYQGSYVVNVNYQ